MIPTPQSMKRCFPPLSDPDIDASILAENFPYAPTLWHSQGAFTCLVFSPTLTTISQSWTQTYNAGNKLRELTWHPVPQPDDRGAQAPLSPHPIAPPSSHTHGGFPRCPYRISSQLLHLPPQAYLLWVPGGGTCYSEKAPSLSSISSTTPLKPSPFSHCLVFKVLQVPLSRILQVVMATTSKPLSALTHLLWHILPDIAGAITLFKPKLQVARPFCPKFIQACRTRTSMQT